MDHESEIKVPTQFCNFIPSFHNFTPSFINPPTFVLSLYTPQICESEKSAHAIFGTHTRVKVEVYKKYVSLCTINYVQYTVLYIHHGNIFMAS
jgi:hypothetical protein